MADKTENATDTLMIEHILGGRFLTSDDGSVRVPALMIGQTTRELFDATVKMRNEYKWRDGDFLLASFLKNGTHFMWEIMMMLLQGSADYMPSNLPCFIDIPYTFSRLDEEFPTERVLDTHFRLDVLPKQFRDKKTVLVIRNPKDAVTSWYPFFKANIGVLFSEDTKVQDWLANLTFRDFLHIFLYNDENQLYGSYFSYTEYMWNLAKDNPNILVIFYEDLKEKTLREIEKVNAFMGTDCSQELMQEIAEATNFDKMREGKAGTTGPPEEGNGLFVYRKGQIGDWKNRFTVADNELFDEFLEGWSISKEIPFRYTPSEMRQKRSED